MKNILLILGSESGEFAKGQYNKGLFEAAKDYLSGNFNLLTTIVEDAYDIDKEYEKWQQADFIIFQYPVYWFMMPSILKKYLDDVYAYGRFFAFTDGPYGSGGLMKGKKFMLSTTWNAPEDSFETDFFDGGDRDAVLLPMRKSQAYCGLEELEHFSAHDVIKNPDFDRDKKAFIEHLTKVFN